MGDVDGYSGCAYHAIWIDLLVDCLEPSHFRYLLPMMNRLRTTLLNYVLSSLVMAWGILPPALAHSHEGGDDAAHRHDECSGPVEVVEHHGHSLDDDSHEHGHHRHMPDDASQLGSLVGHLHWEILGIDMSMPLPGDGHQGDQAEVLEPVLICLTDEMPGLTGGTNVLLLQQAMMCEATLECAADDATPKPVSGIDAPIPLCDAARFERSGVLLS